MKPSSIPLWPLLLLVFLSACARKPLSAEQQKAIDVVSAVSFLGDEFVIDVTSRSLLRAKETAIDVRAWKMDESFRDLLRERVQAGGRDFRPFALDQEAVDKALGQRENRWKRVLGKQSQALMELLFREAEKQGIHFFFLALPLNDADHFPLHKGTMGVYCSDRQARHAKANPYFKFELTVWNVTARKKTFRAVVDPELTSVLQFSECEAVAEMKELGRELENPVKQALALVTDALVEKLGWAKQYPEHPQPPSHLPPAPL